MSPSLSIAVIGAGSSYTPVLLSELNKLRAHADLSLMLYDRDPERTRLATELALAVLPTVASTECVELGACLQDAEIVLHLYRAGPHDYRSRQELKARELDLIGQETQGFGGAASAMCNIAALREISEQARVCNPGALHIAITNPTGIMTAAASAVGLNAVGLCELPYVLQAACNEACKAMIELEYIGLNHFAWIVGGRREDGTDCSAELLAHGTEIATTSRPPNIPIAIPSDVIELFGAIPTPYLAYYYATRTVLADQRASETRAARVQSVNDAARAALLRDDFAKALTISRGRGGHMLGTTIVTFLKAWLGAEPRELILCRSETDSPMPVAPELPVAVSAKRLVTRSPTAPVHPHIAAMIETMRTYEMLILQAALCDDLDSFEQALVTHPLVRELQTAQELRCFHESVMAEETALNG